MTLDRLVSDGDTTSFVVGMLFGLALVSAAIAGIILVSDGGNNAPGVGNASADSPGGEYGGVVGVQEAEVRSEYDTQAFEAALANASSAESRAAIIEQETDRIDSRLGELEGQRANLTIDNESRTQITAFVARSETVSYRLDRVEQAAGDLPSSVRTDSGLTTERFDDLRTRAAALTTQEMQELAQGVAGENIGDGFDDHDDDDRDDRDDDRDDDQDDGDDRDDGPDTENSSTDDRDDDETDDDTDDDEDEDGDDDDDEDEDDEDDEE